MNNIGHVVSILKNALIVDKNYKNELIEDAIKALDPEEYTKMKKEFNDLLDEMSSRK